MLLLAFIFTFLQKPVAELPGFRPSVHFQEQIREQWIAEGVRVVMLAPGDFDPKKPTRLILFATPNGNSIEQSLGCAKADGLDWHFDIQHVAAQVRAFRNDRDNLVLACLEAEGLSWPAWKKKYADGPARVKQIVGAIRQWVPGDTVSVTLAAHSGGGSFLFGFIDSDDAIPASIERIIFLDANYSYTESHGVKFVAWLKANPKSRLVVIAYDDRKITYNGKLVVGPDGGTFRATERMRSQLAPSIPFTESKTGPFTNTIAFDGRFAIHVHANPENRILHTALVGEMNGLMHGLDPQHTLGEPRLYEKFVQPAPSIPARSADAVGGKAFFATLTKLSREDREAAVRREISRGNIPDFLRTFQKVSMKGRDAAGKEHAVVLEVMPDYLAVGSNDDFVRVPMTPMTASFIADQFGCSLPTVKMVDAIHQAATVKLEPQPLTEAREASATFAEHNSLIETQRAGQKLGQVVSGIKKDVVLSNRIGERPNRVAIYGWHQLDGKPIQPLTIVHVNWYVDYSHGVRLVKRTVMVDGKPQDLHTALYSKPTCDLLSDEGPIRFPGY